MNGNGTLDLQSGLTGEEIQACLNVIREGGAVNLAVVKMRLPEAVLVALKRDGQEIVAVGAIKQKRPKYAAAIAKKCGFAFETNTHELGYVAVKGTHRGKKLSHHIAAALLAQFRDRPIFATTSNPYMKITLTKLGFIQRGNEWKGNDGNPLSLWMKDAELPI